METWYEITYYGFMAIGFISLIATFTFVWKIPKADTLQNKYHFQIMSAILALSTLVLFVLVLMLTPFLPDDTLL